MDDSISAYSLPPLNNDAVLALINQKRALAGLNLLGGFAGQGYGGALAPSPDAEKGMTERQRLDELGVAAVERKRAEMALQRVLLQDRKRPGETLPLRPEPQPIHIEVVPVAPSERFPARMPIWPLVVAHSIKLNCSGAVRAWSFAHALDPQGCGAVKRADLLDYLDHLGVPYRTRYRWVAAAINDGLFREARGGHRLVLCGLERLARRMGMREVGWRVLVSSAALAHPKNWRGCAWDACHSLYTGSPISRERLEGLTTVTRRTQVNYEKRGCVQVCANYAVDERFNEHDLEMYRELSGRDYAFTIDYYGVQKIAFQRPNTYTPSMMTEANGGKRRSSAIRLALYGNASAVASDTPMSCDGPEPITAHGCRESTTVFPAGGVNRGESGLSVEDYTGRRYFKNWKALNSNLRKLRRQSIHPDIELYESLSAIRRRTGRYRFRPSHSHADWWYVKHINEEI